MSINQSTLDFLKDLSKNNNRDWYHANKKRFEKEVKKPFESFIANVIDRFREINPDINIQPKEAIFRIYRDTRFSKDKTPYKTHISALVSPHGRKGKEYPGFYFHLEPGMLMMGGGAYFLEKEALQRVRQHIMQQPKAFRKIVEDPTFVETYGELKGEKNKILPKEFKEFGEKEPLIYNKQFYYMHEMPPKTILQDDFMDVVVDHYKAGAPLNQFVLEALS